MRALLALTCSMALAGCLPMAGRSYTDPDRTLRAGDYVRVETREGARHAFRVTKVEDQAFYGVAPDDKSYRVPYGALKSLQVRQDDTTWISLGIVESAILTAVFGRIMFDP